MERLLWRVPPVSTLDAGHSGLEVPVSGPVLSFSAAVGSNPSVVPLLFVEREGGGRFIRRTAGGVLSGERYMQETCINVVLALVVVPRSSVGVPPGRDLVSGLRHEPEGGECRLERLGDKAEGHECGLNTARRRPESREREAKPGERGPKGRLRRPESLRRGPACARRGAGRALRDPHLRGREAKGRRSSRDGGRCSPDARA